MNSQENRRILIIDDNPSIHEDFRKILESTTSGNSSLDAKAKLLFGETERSALSEGFLIDSAFQGDEGLEKVTSARNNGEPYALAFVDVRMPPGMDGVETIERAWKADTNIQFVICSAYSDYNASDILVRFGASDRLLLLRKPCDTAEILLLATAMCQKWNLANSLIAQA